MSSVFVIGAGGVGKTTLINSYMEQTRSTAILIKEVARRYMEEKGITRSDLQEEEVFWNLQSAVAQRQLEQEDALGGQHFISDRSVVDAVSYAAQIKPDRFRLLTCEDCDMKHGDCGGELFAPLLPGLQRDRIDQIVQRYQRSLVLLVNPFSDKVEDDGVRKVADVDELEKFTVLCRRTLNLLNIPFLDLRERDHLQRVLLLRKALTDFTLPSPLSKLQHHENLSSKKVDRQAAVRHYRSINLPFYRPRENDTDVPCLCLTSSQLRLSFFAPPPGRTSRFLLRFGTKRIFLLEFSPEIHDSEVRELLYFGLKIQGEIYSFLGCSSTGLKNRKCYLWKGSASDANKVRQDCGDFEQIKSIPKQIARFSLLLTNVVPTNVKPKNIFREADVLKDGENFTDGCGCISPDLAGVLFQQTKDALTRKRDRVIIRPSVFQIRFQGYKGVVVRNSGLESGSIVIRPSMEKFSTDRFPHIAVCDFSRPFSFGHLNRQFILLLSGLGVPDEVFVSLQQEHFDRVRRMLFDRDAALMLLEWQNRANELVAGALDKMSSHEKFGPSLLERLRPLQNQLIKESSRLRILVPESRTIFGVAETPQFCSKTGQPLPGKLRPGECLVRVTMRGKPPFSLHDQPVIVSKNPCYLLGDIRVLRAVSSIERPDLECLERDMVDCIVFPINGARSHSAEIAGSDLDGDQYFVCWDRRLIPPTLRSPYSYPAYSGKNAPVAKPQHQSRLPPQVEQMVDYFSVQNKVRRTTGSVDSLFRAWADLHGVTCVECERLGQLFSRVVDSAKSGEHVEIPRALFVPRDHRPSPGSNSRFVWQRMEFAASEFVQEQEALQSAQGTLHEQQLAAFAGLDDTDSPETDFELDEEESHDTFLLGFVARNHLAMSEFTKFRLVMQHLNNDVDSFLSSAFLEYVNFALFSPAERGFAVDRHGVPPFMLNNSLRCYSILIGCRSSFLYKYGLDKTVPWQFYWRTKNQTGTVACFGVLKHALRNNSDLLMILQAPDGVIILLRFSRSVLGYGARNSLFSDSEGVEKLEGRTLREFAMVQAFFISGHFGYMEKYSLSDSSYQIDMLENGLQIYRGARGQTFIHVKAAECTGISRGKQKKKRKDGDSENEWTTLQLSVDLTRFNRRILLGERRHPLIRKTPVHTVEMFVYNRRFNYSERPDNSISYFDVLVEGEKDSVAFPEYDPDVSLVDEDSVVDMLSEGCELEKYQHFVANLNGLLTDPQQSLGELMSLLQTTLQHFGLCNCMPSQLNEAIYTTSEIVVPSIIPLLEVPEMFSTVANIFGLLAALDIRVFSDLPPTSVDQDTFAMVKEQIRIFSRWDLWLALSKSDLRKDLFLWLKAEMDESQLNSRLAFVYRNACEQASVLMSELDEDGSDCRATASISRLGNLRLDPSQPIWQDSAFPTDKSSRESGKQEALPTITLYRVQAVPADLAFSVGEFVCVSRQTAGPVALSTTCSETNRQAGTDGCGDLMMQDYHQNFPPLGVSYDGTKADDTDKRILDSQGACEGYVSKDMGSCLGRVVSLCEAPFSISIKLTRWSFGQSRAPELLLRCLQTRASVFWQVTAVPANVVTHMRNMDAISSFLDPDSSELCGAGADVLPYLFEVDDLDCDDEPEKTPVPKIGAACQARGGILNPRQEEAVQASLQHPVSLVHGPPGTGKTTTALEIVRHILEHSDHRILVCAETNLAVDNLALRFLEVCGVLHGPIRVGRETRKKREDAVDRISLETLVRKKAALKETRKFFVSRHKKEISELLQGARVVFTTCAGTGDPVLRDQRFESVLMDEASMTTEPSALCPLVHGCCHLTLIGDHKQLGPHSKRGSSLSLFERLSNPKPLLRDAKMTMLNEQHRMHPALCSFPSRAFYGGELLTASGIEEARAIPQCFFVRKSPLRFIDVPEGSEQRIRTGSWYNEVEIDATCKLLKQLIGTDELSASDVTVLTFYRAQQLKLRERFLCWSDIPEVCSVDSFQGRENEVIVVNTVRCGRYLGFCDDERRINVLLTRAKRGLIILGCRKTLEISPLWSWWLREAA